MSVASKTYANQTDNVTDDLLFTPAADGFFRLNYNLASLKPDGGYDPTVYINSVTVTFTDDLQENSLVLYSPIGNVLNYGSGVFFFAKADTPISLSISNFNNITYTAYFVLESVS